MDSQAGRLGPAPRASRISESGEAVAAAPRVVIVGAGFGGLAAAKAVARAPVRITLIDRVNHHCFQPLLYQVATGTLSPADIAWPVRSIFSHQPHTEILMAEVTGIDVCARALVLKGEKRLAYDYLILATGATHSYFGHEEWSPAAPGLKRIEDATGIRRRLLLAFEQAELEDDEAQRRRLMTFVVVGGGPTGVEMAGAIADMARLTLARDFRRIDPRNARIVLVEAGPRLLAAFPDTLSRYAQRALQSMHVEVQTSVQVVDLDGHRVRTAGGDCIAAETVIWAAGVTASPAATWLAVPADRSGRIRVEPDLSVPGHPEIFAIGDTALARGPTGTPAPGLAPAAKQMGHYVGRLIAARVQSRAEPAPFRYRHLGDLATIGRKQAVVSFGRLRLTGFVAWVFWSVAHIYFLIGVRNRVVVALNWIWEYVTLQRGARLILRAVPFI
jgi:NADH:ubiquinone reductase (H+-translocating)